MKVFLGSDHGGFALKEVLREHVKAQGHEVLDLGTFDGETSVDYPDYAREVAEKVNENPQSCGVLVCGTGIGISIAANKIEGIRAALVHDLETAKMARAHNNANIIAFGGRIMDPELAKQAMDLFLTTPFDGGRHQARIEKITALEHD